ncbi:hypothetical protein [Streptomyces sp. NPDC101115]
MEARRSLFADWTPEEAAAFAAVLERFHRARDVERLDGRPWPRL